MNEFVDQILTCCACSVQFLWCSREQMFYQAHEYAAPRRCRACRDAKRQRFEDKAARECQTTFDMAG